MKKLTLALALTLTAGSAAAADLVEAIVIRVGDRIITTTQYKDRFRDAMTEVAQTTPPDKLAAKKEELKKSFNDELIAELLIKDRADRLGLSVTDAEVKDAVTRLKQQYNMQTDAEFERSLQQAGLTRAEMESRLRDSLLSNKVFARELRSREDMSDKDLRERYDREKEHFRLPERAHLRGIIIVRPEDAAAAARMEQRVDEIARDARVAPDFGKFAASVPENAMKDKGGDMGEVARGELLPDLDKAVFSANPGAIIGPIATKSGWHILKVETRLPSEVPAFESVKDKLRKDASEETFQRDYKVYIDRLRKDAFVEIHDKNIPAV